MVKRKTLDEWLEKTDYIKKEKYQFLDIFYKNNKSYFKLKCNNECCKKCRENNRYNEIIQKCKIIYNDNYCYLGYKIENKRMFILVKCSHMEKYFMTKNHCHKMKECNICKDIRNNNIRLNNFLKEANIIHNNFYKYDEVKELNRLKDTIKIYCPTHKIYFSQIAQNHLNGQGCIVCANIKYSRKQIRWLKLKSIIDNTHIQHILNDGEYTIDLKNKNERKKSVDGYSVELNKVYEFHGDYWHGNPKKFNKKDINPHCNKTYGELYKKTKQRINKIKNLEYIVEEMWEYDWNLHKKLLKEIKKYNKK
jgi:hypothetical protein